MFCPMLNESSWRGVDPFFGFLFDNFVGKICMDLRGISFKLKFLIVLAKGSRFGFAQYAQNNDHEFVEAPLDILNL